MEEEDFSPDHPLGKAVRQDTPLPSPTPSVVEPEPPFLAGAVNKGAAPAPALQLKLQR